MGWWKLEAWKKDSQGNEVELTQYDREHIAKLIIEGCVEGEVVDGDE